MPQLLREVLFGSGNLEQQPRAASETNRLFSENRTFGDLKGSVSPAPHELHRLLKGAGLQSCSVLKERFRGVHTPLSKVHVDGPESSSLKISKQLTWHYR